jgi:hypothetical protein
VCIICVINRGSRNIKRGFDERERVIREDDKPSTAAIHNHLFATLKRRVGILDRIADKLHIRDFDHVVAPSLQIVLGGTTSILDRLGSGSARNTSLSTYDTQAGQGEESMQRVQPVVCGG